MQPEVDLEPLANRTGNSSCTGRVQLRVQRRDVPAKSVCTIEFDLVGADPRCVGVTEQTVPRTACRFSVYSGKSCEGSMGHPMNSTHLAHVLPNDLWMGARYNASADGRASGSTEVLHLGLTQRDLVSRVLVATDADGEPIACGSVDIRCFKVFGFCFYIWARWITGLAAVFAIVDSLWLIRKHMKFNKSPSLRRYTVRILLMVPVYSIQAFVALWFKVAPIHGELLRFFRELYEAIVLFSFLQFILACVGGPAAVVERFDGHKAATQAKVMIWRATRTWSERTEGKRASTRLEDAVSADGLASSASDIETDAALSPNAATERRAALKHIFPWNLLCPPWRSARQMMRICVIGTLSYIVVGILVPISVFLFDVITGCDGEQCEKGLKVGKYMIMLASMAAINSLFELAHIFLHELKDLSPIPKFASVKLVIFFTFWQGIVLSWLVHAGAFEGFIDAEHAWTSQEQISQAFQHSLICIEMFAASVTHHFAFPPEDYKRVWMMQHERTKTDFELEGGGESTIGKHLNVVDFRDIITTARFGFADPNTREADWPESTDESEESEDDEDSAAEDEDVGGFRG